MNVRVVLAAALAVGMVSLVGTRASAFELLDRMMGNGCGCEPKCGCDPKCGVEPKCGCAPKCGVEPKCGCESDCCRPLFTGEHLANLKCKANSLCDSLRAHCDAVRCHLKSACESKCGCEPKCGVEPKCGCAPKCGCEPKCGVPHQKLFAGKCGCEPKCGCGK